MENQQTTPSQSDEIENPLTHPEEKTSPELPSTFKSKRPMKLIFILVAVLLILIPGIYFFTKYNSNKMNEVKTSPISEEQIQTTISPVTVTEGEKTSESVFAVWPLELQIQEPDITLSASEGSFVVNSYLSHDKNQIVYSEISDCISDLNTYRVENQAPCDWTYSIKNKNVQNDEIKTLYSYPEKQTSWLNSVVKQAHAGGCPLVYTPIGWSKNDVKIIVKSVNPTNCGSGGGTTDYLYASIAPSGGAVTKISVSDARFYDDFSKAIVIEETDDSPTICGPVPLKNNGSIQFLNTETGAVIDTVHQSNTDYTLGKVSDDDTSFTYYSKPVDEKDGCAVIDYSSLGEEHTILLPE